MIEDPVAWLRAQLDEDERLARSGIGEYEYFYGDGHSSGVLRFLDRWNPEDPALVLREIEAKRRIVEYHVPTDSCCSVCHGAPHMEEEWDAVDEEETVIWVSASEAFPCTTLRLLALPYVDRPGFREEWCP